jgi:protein-disulfide isomerase
LESNEDKPLVDKEPQSNEDERLVDSEAKSVSMKKATYNKLIFAIIFAALISAFLGGYVLGTETAEPSAVNIGNSNGVAEQNPAKQLESQSNPLSSIVSVSADDDPVKGDPNAPITIIEFSDFQCPFCKVFHETSLPMIEKNYIETGKVKFVYRDYPIQQIHPNAVPAALGANCANEQGKFWEYHDKLFENQRQWENLDPENGVSTFEKYAEELDLDTDTFNTCLESGKYLEEIRKDLQDGVAYGVSGTPGFFIGNEKIGYGLVSGAQPYAAFEQVLNQLLES